MQFLKMLKVMYYTRATAKAYNNFLHSTPSEKKYHQLQSDIVKMAYAMGDYTPEPPSRAYNNMKNTPLWLGVDITFISNFVNKNFTRCLEVAEKFKEIPRMDFYVNRSLKALMEIKTQMPLEEYRQKYGEKEIVLKAEANNVKPQKARGYNGTYITLAYCEYLSGNMQEMQYYLDKQKEYYGVEKIFQNENNRMQPWYYNNISAQYIEFLEVFLNNEMANQPKTQQLLTSHNKP